MKSVFIIAFLLPVTFSVSNYCMFNLALLKLGAKGAKPSLSSCFASQGNLLLQRGFSSKNKDVSGSSFKAIDARYGFLRGNKLVLGVIEKTNGNLEWVLRAHKLSDDPHKDKPLHELRNPDDDELFRKAFGVSLSSYKEKLAQEVPVPQSVIPEQIIPAYVNVTDIFKINNEITLLVTAGMWALHDAKTLKWTCGDWDYEDNRGTVLRGLLWVTATKHWLNQHKIVALMQEEKENNAKVQERYVIQIFDIAMLLKGEVTKPIKIEVPYSVAELKPLAVTPDGEYLIVGGEGVSVYSLKTGAKVGFNESSTAQNKGARCTAVTISTDGKEVFAVMENNEGKDFKRYIKRWFLRNGALQKKSYKKESDDCSVM